MIQKILKVGTSAAVTLPKQSLQELGLKIGDPIVVTVSKEDKKITVEPTVLVDQELITWTKQFIERYRPALEALAKQ